jgi:hypothetical protein
MGLEILQFMVILNIILFRLLWEYRRFGLLWLDLIYMFGLDWGYRGNLNIFD